MVWVQQQQQRVGERKAAQAAWEAEQAELHALRRICYIVESAAWDHICQYEYRPVRVAARELAMGYTHTSRRVAWCREQKLLVEKFADVSRFELAQLHHS